MVNWKARWEIIALQTTNVGEHLTDVVRAIAGGSPKLQSVIDMIVEGIKTIFGRNSKCN